MTARVVVAGLGDTGVLSSMALSRHCDVVAVSTKPGLVSGQELGLRLARPERWARDYRIGFERFRGLDRVEIRHGRLTGLDLVDQRVVVRGANGAVEQLPFDALIIATGVTNGFWRRPDVQSDAAIDDDLSGPHSRIAAAGSVAVVGGGAAAVSSAAQIALAFPGKRVDLYFPGEAALPQHHRRVWSGARRRLEAAGVGLHPGHRARLTEGSDDLAPGPIEWTTGQPPTAADVVLYAVGRVRPNTDWLPPALLDEQGFVRVGADLRVPGTDNVFAVGDVAATDPLRTSARNQGHKLIAHNVPAHLAGRPLREFRPTGRRWGSVLGPLDDGLLVFAPNGRGFRFPAWTIDSVLQPLIVRRGIYGGVRADREPRRRSG